MVGLKGFSKRFRTKVVSSVQLHASPHFPLSFVHLKESSLQDLMGRSIESKPVSRSPQVFFHTRHLTLSAFFFFSDFDMEGATKSGDLYCLTFVVLVTIPSGAFPII